jgi:hypothetical protein
LKQNTINVSTRLLGVSLAAMLLAACAGTGGPVPAEISVEERAQQRWDYLVAREFESAWTLYTPGFRQTTSADDYRRDRARRPVRWLTGQVQDAVCEDDRCQVTVVVTYQAPTAPAGQRRIRMTRNIEETWIRLDGQWWFAQN